MIAIIDYDAGNLKSVEKALIALGEEVIVSRDSSEILQADKVILPGVGSFGDAMNNLDRFGLVDTIKNVVAKDTISWNMPWTSAFIQGKRRDTRS